MIVCDMVVAAPVLMSTPESTPAAMMRMMAGEMSFMPDIIFATVESSPMPPINPPATAPNKSE